MGFKKTGLTTTLGVVDASKDKSEKQSDKKPKVEQPTQPQQANKPR